MEHNSNTEAPMIPGVNDKQKSSNGPKIATTIACVVAICGIGFGIYGMMQSFQKDNLISDLKSQIASKADESNNTNQNGETNSNNNDVIFTINQMGVGIKNVDSAGTISRYTYSKDWHGPDSPISSIEILSFSGVPEIGTDYIAGISGAIIYEYDEESFFDISKCTVQIGKVNGNNLCVARRPINEEYRQLSTEAFNAWNTWAESNIDKLMAVLSNPENYVKI